MSAVEAELVPVLGDIVVPPKRVYIKGGREITTMIYPANSGGRDGDSGSSITDANTFTPSANVNWTNISPPAGTVMIPQLRIKYQIKLKFQAAANKSAEDIPVFYHQGKYAPTVVNIGAANPGSTTYAPTTTNPAFADALHVATVNDKFFQSTILNLGNVNSCLAAFPLQRCMQSLNMTINGTSVTSVPQDIVDMQSWLISEDDRRFFFECPAEPDRFGSIGMSEQGSIGWESAQTLPVAAGNTTTNINDALLTAWKTYTSGQIIQGFQGCWSPLRPFNAFRNTRVVPCFVQTTKVGTNAGIRFLYTFECVEPLLASPFAYGNRDGQPGLIHLENLNINFQMANSNFDLLQRLITSSLNYSITTNTTAQSICFTNHNLIMTYITPDPVLTAKFPIKQILPYESFQVFQDSFGSVQTVASFSGVTGYSLSLVWTVNKTTAGSTFPIASPWEFGNTGDLSSASGLGAIVGTLQAQKMPMIPRKIYMYVKPTTGVYNDTTSAQASTGNIFLEICYVSLTFGNRIGLLQNLTPTELYQMSVENGYKGTWDDWLTTGGVLIIDPVKNLGLEPGQFVGIMGEVGQLQATIGVSSRPIQLALTPSSIPTTRNYTVYTVFDYDGAFSIAPNIASYTTEVMRPAEAIAADVKAGGEVAKPVDVTGSSKVGQVGAGLYGGGRITRRGGSLIVHSPMGGAAVGGAIVGGSAPTGGSMEGGEMDGGDMEGGGYRRKRRHYRER